MRYFTDNLRSLALLGLALALPVAARAQALTNYGGSLNIGAGASVYVQGDLLNAAGSTLTNAGTLRVTGNTTTNAAVSAGGGTLVLAGSSAQTLGGTADYNATDVQLTNAAGLTLTTRLRVAGAMTFSSGIVTAASAAAPLTFGPTGTVAGTPTDASHVLGYVAKEGTGAFTYPLGDGTRYQPTATTLTANSAGLLARYVPADAGAAPFTAGGTAATPLLYYNRFEYWDLAPVGTATGSVTVFFDSYQNPGITAVADLRVAHKSGGAWLNEGAAASSGTAAAGSVTSNALSTWSPFALGSIAASSPLPVELTDFAAERQGEAARLSWATASEMNSQVFEVERSTDGRTFGRIGQVAAAGSSSSLRRYSFLDQHISTSAHQHISTSAHQLITYYRLRQVDRDGTFSYSPVRALAGGTGPVAFQAVAWPNPAEAGRPTHLLVRGPEPAQPLELTLTDAAGRVLAHRTVVAGQADALALPETAGLPAGVYLLAVRQGTGQQVLRLLRE